MPGAAVKLPGVIVTSIAGVVALVKVSNQVWPFDGFVKPDHVGEPVRHAVAEAAQPLPRREPSGLTTGVLEQFESPMC